MRTNSKHCHKHSRALFEKRMGNEFQGEILGEQYAGYVFKITGGNDKSGFTMKQGILKAGRVRLLMSKGHSCFRPRRTGQRKRKSVRGCIVGKDISVLAITIVKHGDKPIVGITDVKKPRKLGPKRVTKIKKLYKLDSKDDPRKFVVRRTTKHEKNKAPKIQRLVTKQRIRRKKVVRKRREEAWAKNRQDLADYRKLLADRRKHHKVDKKPEAKTDSKPAKTDKPVAEKTNQ